MERRLRLLRPVQAAGSAGRESALEDLDVTVGEPAEGAANEVPEPKLFTESDVAPAFRADLRIESGSSPGLFQVIDPRRGRSFVLYEFELSIARMLDGRRRVSNVVESAVRLGIPVDVPGLYKFVRQLWNYGFLAASGSDLSAATDDGSGWPERARWDEATRTLFQTGLRLMRQGRPSDASSYFEAVLGADPGNEQAAELLAAVARGESISPTTVSRHLLAPSGGPPASSGGTRRVRRLLAAAAAMALAAGAAFWWAAGPPRDGDEGRAAGAPDPIAVDRARPAPTSAAAAPNPASLGAARVVERRHPARAEIVSPARGAVIWARPQAAAVRRGDSIGFVRVDLPPTTRGDARLGARVAELERLAARDPVYREFLEKARRDRRRLARPAVHRVPLAAPETGRLSVAVPSGTRAAEGDLVGSIVDAETWRLTARAHGAEPPPGAGCEVRGDAVADRAPCTVVAARDRGEWIEISATLPAELAPWLGDATAPEVWLAPTRTAAGTPSSGGNP